MTDSMVLVSPWMYLGDLAEFAQESRQNQFDGVNFVCYLHRLFDLHIILHSDVTGCLRS